MMFLFRHSVDEHLPPHHTGVLTAGQHVQKSSFPRPYRIHTISTNHKDYHQIYQPEDPIKAVIVPGSKYPVTPLNKSSSSPPGKWTLYHISLKEKETASNGNSFMSSI